MEYEDASGESEGMDPSGMARSALESGREDEEDQAGDEGDISCAAPDELISFSPYVLHKKNLYTAQERGE